MNVLTSKPRFLTVDECKRVTMFQQDIAMDAHYRKYGQGYAIDGSASIIQEWFDQWCGEASAEYNLHPDDDRDELWAKFCEVVGR